MRENIHTVYDRMAAKGYFRNNPANIDSRDPNSGESIYKGPIAYPKMLYHPEGKKRVMSPEVTVPGPAGSQVVPATYEIVNKIVKNKAEFDEAKALGWHEHPSDAFWASLTEEEQLIVERPAKSAQTRISTLEQQLEDMRKELEAARAGTIQDDSKNDEENA